MFLQKGYISGRSYGAFFNVCILFLQTDHPSWGYRGIFFYFSWVFFKKLNCYENRIRLDEGGTGNLVLQLKNSGFAGKSMGFVAM